MPPIPQAKQDKSYPIGFSHAHTLSEAIFSSCVCFKYRSSVTSLKRASSSGVARRCDSCSSRLRDSASARAREASASAAARFASACCKPACAFCDAAFHAASSPAAVSAPAWSASRCEALRHVTEMGIPCMATKQGPNILLFMSHGTRRILFISVLTAAPQTAGPCCRSITDCGPASPGSLASLGADALCDPNVQLGAAADGLPLGQRLCRPHQPGHPSQPCV
jgi:hypothetical protein